MDTFWKTLFKRKGNIFLLMQHQTLIRNCIAKLIITSWMLNKYQTNLIFTLYTWNLHKKLFSLHFGRARKVEWTEMLWYLGLRSGGAKQVIVGMGSFEGFCTVTNSFWVEADAWDRDNPGELRSFFNAGWEEELCPRKLRLRFGERLRRRALNCRSSSPSRFPREVRRTGLVKLGRRRLRREWVAGDGWKDSSESSFLVSTIEGRLGSC